MKRTIIRCSVLLLVGAIITVAVSWAASARVYVGANHDWPQTTLWLEGAEAERQGWPAPVPVSWLGPDQWSRGEVTGYTHIYAAHFRAGLERYRSATSQQAGWPARALEAVQRLDSDEDPQFMAWRARLQTPGVHYLSLREGLLLVRPFGPSGLPEMLLPLRPMPLGFATNTLVYAAGVWALLAGAGGIRRWRRRRRCRCSRCGYPRAGLAQEVACPECGDGVRQ